jgi:hypothetical protein
MLVDYLMGFPEVQILSYHPTSAKAYQSEIIRISRKLPNGKRTRDRYHVDLIFVYRDELWLTELKCSLSESWGDIAKLNDIASSYTLEELKALIAGRLTCISPAALKGIRRLVLSLGVMNIDSSIPEEFVVFQAREDSGVSILNRDADLTFLA